VILYDFKCRECGEKFEAFAKLLDRETTCKLCGGTADRLISAPRAKLDPISGDFPGATLRWEKQHENPR
jgi:putative FmdB family regulatory protein